MAKYKKSAKIFQEQANEYLLKLCNESNPSLSIFPTKTLGQKTASYSFSLSAKTNQNFREILSVRNEEMFTICLMIYGLLLTRLSGQEDIALLYGVKKQIKKSGYYSPIRIQIGKKSTFGSLIADVTAQIKNKYHTSVDFLNAVQKFLKDNRKKNKTLFNVLFSKKTRNPTRLAYFDMHLSYESSRIIKFNLDYNPELFEDWVIQSIAHQYVFLIEKYIKNKNTKILSFPLIPNKQIKKFQEWNEVSLPLPNKPIHQLFEQQVIRVPDAVALVFEEEKISYHELNQRANKLAEEIKRVYFIPEDKLLPSNTIIGICLERSIEMIVAWLGVLKAGGAYVPLDPNFPEQRLRFLIQDAGIDLVLTQQKLVASQTMTVSKKIIDVSEYQFIANEYFENSNLKQSSDRLMAVIYTSGSTGEPKGVKVAHKGVINWVLWSIHTYLINENDKILQKTSFTFDISISEICTALLSGAQLILAKPDGQKDPLYLASIIKNKQITLLQFVPSMLEVFLSSFPKNEITNILANIRYLFFGGEGMPIALKENLQALLNARLINWYGPTETSIGITSFEKSNYMTLLPLMPIGKGIANAKLYVLDEHLNPVAIGVPGELYIGGLSVTKGYLNRPELTKKSFVDNPFEDKTKLYKTGDTVRWQPDGNLEFLSRKDFQVKIRGFRVELGEIEAQLNKHVDIRQCVIVLQNINGAEKLIAYFVARKKSPSAESLKSYLKEKLPDYMVPDFFVKLVAIPLAVSGKIDRKALPKVQGQDFVDAKEILVAKTEKQQMLVDIFCEVLNIEKIGIHNNFFESGGDSLLGAQVVSRIRNILRIECSLPILFEYPTIEQLANYLEKITTDPSLNQNQIIPLDRKINIPLSSAQQRLWFIDQYEGPESAVHNTPLAFYITGPLQTDILKKAINEIIARHQVLHTAFEIVGDEVFQVVVPVKRAVITVDKIKKNVLNNILDEEAHFPFQLTRSPLMRVRILQLSLKKHVFIVTFHHIVFDGWSVNVFLNELKLLYEAELAGVKADLPAVKIQYGDFSAWQRNLLKTPALQQQIQYWKIQLQDFETLNLRTDFPRPTYRVFKGQHFRFILNSSHAKSIRLLMKETQTTLFMVLVAVLDLLLYRYTNQEDLVLGTIVANRSYHEIENLIGLFVNVVSLRVNLSGNPSIIELLQMVKETCLGAYKNQEIPFEYLVDQLNIERDTSRTPIFQVLCILQMENKLEESFLPGLQIEKLYPNYNVAKYDLTFNFIERDKIIECDIEYNTGLYTAETISRMAQHYLNLLDCLSMSSHQLVGQISMLSTKEKQQLLFGFNCGEKLIRKSPALHHLFEEQVGKTPNNIALFFKEDSITYEELNHKANKVAHWLRNSYKNLAGKEWQAETLIGLYLERNFEMIVSLLAVLKAGGAFVPLDPDLPRDRLEFMIEDAQIGLILTLSDVLHSHEKLQCRSKIINLDAEWNSINKNSNHNIRSNIQSNHLMYVMYTSGSTGRPKGVLVENKGIVNRVEWIKEKFPLKYKDRNLFKTPFGFDVSIAEIFWPLVSGAGLVIADPGGQKDLFYLTDTIQKYAITNIHFVPSLLNLYLEVLDDQQQYDKITSLKIILCSGEALSSIMVNKLLERLPVTVVNLYGPTEAAIEVSYFECESTSTGLPYVPIGKPISNVNLYVLDKWLSPVPVGVVGELYINGDAPARGYLGRADLTAESFLQNPFIKNSKIFKTGDLAYWLPSGNLYFLGRADSQIKIRGFRVELSEIEETLKGHSEIEQCVVILWEKNREKFIVAYYVPLSGNKLEMDELKTFLREKLPDYMIPSFFIPMKFLPISSNGKLDKKRLPFSEESILDYQKEYVLPRNATEKKLVKIWQKILSLQKISIEDSFFSLGGHSLLAIQLTYMINQGFNIQISVRHIFEYPTIASLAKFVETKEGVQYSPWPQIIPDLASRYEPFPLSEIQQAYLLGRQDIFQLGDAATHEYIELDMLPLDVKKLETALNKIINRHDLLKAVIFPEGIQRILQVVPYYKIEVYDWRKINESDQQRRSDLLREELTHQEIQCASWPLFDIRVSRFKEFDRIHLSLDALIFDGSSTAIFFKEWSALYSDLNSMLPELKLSYRDYLLACEKFKQTYQYQLDKEYWLEKVSGFPLGPDLPLKTPPDLIKSPRFSRLQKNIKISNWKKLQENSSQFKITPTLICLTAYAEVLRLWSKNQDFTINLTLFNRLPLHEQVNELVGTFTSLELLAIQDLEKQSTFLQKCNQLQNRLLEDLDHSLFSGIEFQRFIARYHNKINGGLFPVVFTSGLNTVQNYEESNFSNRFIRTAYGISQTSQVWLDCQISADKDGLHVVWDYVEDLFFPEMISTMFDVYVGLLNQLAVIDWTTPVPSLFPAEMSKIINEINATETELPQILLHEGFFIQAKKTPEAFAVLSEGKCLTYQELSDFSNRVANALIDHGAEPNHLIAIIMEKGWEQIVASLAILQSSAAYIPIDADWPLDRIENILSQTKVKIILIQEKIIDYLGKLNNFENYLCLSVNEKKLWLNYETTGPTCKSNLDDLAYVIFTSGTTGNPKGVMINHQGAVNTIYDVNCRFQVNTKDRVLALSNLSFDLSVYDIFGLLSVGGGIVIPHFNQLKDPAYWLNLLNQYKVTLWNSVPMLMNMLIEYMSLTSKNVAKKNFQLKTVMLSGDWIPSKLPEQIHEHFNKVKIISLGGATEASIWSVIYPIQKPNPYYSSIPYGRPMANQKMYVLNSALEFCPMYVVGELYIGGIGVALGYWQDKVKTENSFIRHPITQEYLYKTGDLGRWWPDGLIEFLGRENFQVKIGGYRIELEEIEEVAKKHPAIQNAIATVQINEHQKKQLALYVILNKEKNSKLLSTQEAVDRKIMDRLWSQFREIQHHKEIRAVTINLQNYLHFLQELDNLTLSVLCNTLAKLGFFTKKGESYSLWEIVNFGKINSRYEILIYQWLEFLIKEKILDKKDDKYVNLKPFSLMNLSESLENVQIYLNYGKNSQYALQYFEQSFLNHIAMLRDELDPVEILFPQGSWQVAESLYQHNPLISYHASLVIKILESTIKNRFSKSPITVMSVGSGIGGLEASLFPLFSPERTDFIYTDISLFFTNQAKKKFANFPFIRYGIWDINKDPLLEGYSPHSMDIIIAANVLHNARDINVTLNYVRSLLAPGGILIIFEGTRNSKLQMTSFGFLEGFSAFSDERLEVSAPLMSSEKWQRLLKKNGFIHCLDLGENQEFEDVFKLHVIVATAPLVVEKFNSELLIQYLIKKLPNYMLPNAYKVLERLPLTPNGKFDRKLLPNINASHSLLQNNFIEPRTETEKKLATIFEDILGLDDVSIDASFFELGGDSLLAVKTIARIQTDFEQTINIRVLFEEKTVEQLAKHLKNLSSLKSTSENYHPIMAYNERGSRPPLFFVHPGYAGATSYAEFVQYLNPDQPLYVIDSYNLYSGKPFLKTITSMAKKYIQYIKMIQPSGPYYLGGWSLGGLIAYEIAQQLVREGHFVANVYILDFSALTPAEKRDQLNLQSARESLLFRSDLYQQLSPVERKRLVKTMRVEYNAIFHYEIKPYAHKVVLFKATQDQTIEGKDFIKDGKKLSRHLKDIVDKKNMGWEKYLKHFQIFNIPGTHYTILQDKNLAMILDVIQTDLIEK